MKRFPSVSQGLAQPSRSWLFGGAAFGLYILAFGPLYAAMGPDAADLSILPVALIAWLFGLRAGFVAALAAMPLNVLLLSLVGAAGWSAGSFRHVVSGWFAILMIALLVGYIRDLTTRLRDSETQARQLSDAAFEGLVIHDKGIILDVNQAFCRMYGYARSVVIGRSALDLTAPAYRALVWQKIAAGDTEPYEGFALCKDGTFLHVEVMGRPITYRGRVCRVSPIRDISERAQAQAALDAERNLLRTVIDNLHYTMGVWART